jgi:hypothetical protein
MRNVKERHMLVAIFDCHGRHLVLCDLELNKQLYCRNRELCIVKLYNLKEVAYTNVDLY